MSISILFLTNNNCVFNKCQDTLDTTIINGSSDEVVVIGPYNTAGRMDEYTYVFDPSENGGGKVQ